MLHVGDGVVRVNFKIALKKKLSEFDIQRAEFRGYGTKLNLAWAGKTATVAARGNGQQIQRRGRSWERRLWELG